MTYGMKVPDTVYEEALEVQQILNYATIGEASAICVGKVTATYDRERSVAGFRREVAD